MHLLIDWFLKLSEKENIVMEKLPSKFNGRTNGLTLEVFGGKLGSATIFLVGATNHVDRTS